MLRELKKKIGLIGFCILIIAVIQLSFSFPPFLKINAQEDILDLSGLNAIQEQVELTVTPKNPHPGESINANIQSAGIDLNRSEISWYVNGALKASGTGVITFNTSADELGKPLTILVKVTPAGGGAPIEKSASLSAQDVDIIWEADSYTPPFYKGKSLYSEEGNVRLVAMPNIINKSGSRVSPSNLVYKWSVDNSVIGSKSGYGRNILLYSGSILAKETVVEVEVSAPDGTTGVGILLLAPQSPTTILYEDDPLYGVMFNRAVTDGYKMKGREIRVAAYPYFFSAAGKNASNISYAWTMNGELLPIPSQKNSPLFRNADNLSGSAKISVVTDDSVHILQHAQAQATVNF